MSAEDWEWCGQAHHFVAADSCRFHLTTWVNGARFMVSTVGDYRPTGAKSMQPIGAGDSSFFETFVFATDPNDREPGSGHAQVSDWSEVEGRRCATHEQANVLHLEMCRTYDAMEVSP